MADQVTREIEVPASPESVWERVTADGWLADEVEIDLSVGGDATFRSDGEERTGWVEEVHKPSRLTFWWAANDEPASRVELTLDRLEDGGTRLRVIEARPLELLDLVGLPLSGGGTGQRGYGPALLAGAR
jgi:uncharacterized protein YndB with AHSA1/START domain